MSLHWRLIISYIIIIVVCLTLAFLTLILIAQPVQGRLAGLRLSTQSLRIASQINSLYRRGMPTEEILPRLDSWARQNQTHLVFVDQRGTVLADSQDVWLDQQHLVPIREQDRPLSRSAAQTGVFDAPEGTQFIYAVAPVGPANRQAGYVAVVAPRSLPLFGLITELGWGFLAAGIVALLVSLLLGVVIARSIALPLQRIARAAGAVAAGDYRHRLQERGPPEIKRVASSFNVMTEWVESSQRAMRDFVSNVSHELKTPLTSIQGFSQAIMEGATQDEAAQRRAAGIIHQEASRMARMVEDLLDLARIDSGQVVMNKTRLDLTQILTRTVERLLPQAGRKKIKLVKKWNNLPPVVGDGDRLAQVFTNLLDNAVRHTPTEGQVTISSNLARGLPRPRRVRPAFVQANAPTALSERGDFIEISIADTGPGIPPDDLARVFERFYQVDKSRKQGRGTGLGLAIVKEIIDAHGGYIRAQSKEGVGTKFTVVLPITEADAQTLISPRR
jgi:two-component system OmpR family sensor kinase